MQKLIASTFTSHLGLLETVLIFCSKYLIDDKDRNCALYEVRVMDMVWWRLRRGLYLHNTASSSKDP